MPISETSISTWIFFDAGSVVLQVSGDAVVEAHAEGEEEVGLLDGGVHVRLAVHPHHAEAERVAARKAAEAEERQRHGRAGLLGEGLEDLRRPRLDDAVAREDEGALGGGDQLGGLPQVASLELGERAAAGRLHGLGPAELRRRLLHVLADVDEDRAGAARAGDLERLDEGGGEVLDLRHEDVVLRDRHRDADDVGFLEGVRAEDLRGDLAGDEDDRDRVEHRRGDAGDEVRGAGTRRAEGDADAAAGAGVAVGRVRAPLLVPHEDVVDRVLRHRVVDRQDRPAGIAEDGVDAFADEAFPDDLRSGLLHEVLPAVRPTGWVVCGVSASLAARSSSPSRRTAPRAAFVTRAR